VRLAEKQIVDEFMKELDDIERRAPMLGSYSRVQPEIVDHEQAGHQFRFITYHQESHAWYRAGMKEWSLVLMDQAHFVHSDDVIFDLGCNAGYLSIWFALRAKHGHVHAFDPFPWNAAATRVQAKLNGISNISVHCIGIGPERKTLRVPVSSSKTIADLHNSEVPMIDLQIEPLGSFAGAAPSFAKIDIEGAEHELGPSVIQSGVARGYVEMHPSYIEVAGGRPARLLEELVEARFTVAAHGPGATEWKAGAPVEPIGYYFERKR
jgi:FkbM family methyltransferase